MMLSPLSSGGPGPDTSRPEPSQEPNPKSVQQVRHPKPTGAGAASNPKLSRPLTKRGRRVLANKTHRLTELRQLVNQELLRESAGEQVRLDDNVARVGLLVQRERLRKEGRRHLKKQVKRLANQKRLRSWDPSKEPAKDIDLRRVLLRKLKAKLKPLMERSKESEGKPRRTPSKAGDSSAVASLSQTEADIPSSHYLKNTEKPRAGVTGSPMLVTDSEASGMSKKVESKRKRTHGNDHSDSKANKVMKAGRHETPSSVGNSEHEGAVPKADKAHEKERRETPSLDSSLSVSAASEKKRPAAMTERKQRGEANGIEKHKGMTEDLSKDSQKNDKRAKLDKKQKRSSAPARNAKDAVISASGKDLARESRKLPSEGVSKSDKSESIGEQKSKPKKNQPPSIKISEAAASPASKETLNTQSARQLKDDPNQHYFSRRRAEILNDPLGFDDCVEDVPAHRRKQRKHSGPPVLMSGGINPGITFDDKGEPHPIANANFTGSPQLKTKHGKNINPRRDSSSQLAPSSLSLAQPREKSHDERAAIRKVPLKPRLKTTDLGRKFKRERYSSQPKPDSKRASVSDTGAGKSHTAVNTPQSTDTSLSQATVCGAEKGKRIEEVKELGKEGGGDTHVHTGSSHLRALSGDSVDTATAGTIKTKLSTYLPSSTNGNRDEIYGILTRGIPPNQGSNRSSLYPHADPKPVDMYSTAAGSGTHVKDPMQRRPRRMSTGDASKQPLPNQQKFSAMPLPNRSWWKQDRAVGPTPGVKMFSSGAPAGTESAARPKQSPRSSNSVDPKAPSPSEKNKSLASKSAVKPTDKPVLHSTSPIPLPRQVAPYIGGNQRSPIPFIPSRITSIPPPRFPPMAAKTSSAIEKKKKKKNNRKNRTRKTKKPFLFTAPTYQPDNLPKMPTSPSLLVAAKHSAKRDLVSVIHPDASPLGPRTHRSRTDRGGSSANLSNAQAIVPDKQRTRDQDVLTMERAYWHACVGLSDDQEQKLMLDKDRCL